MEIEDESSDMKAGRLGRNTDNKLRSMSRSRSQGAKKVLNETETRMNNLRKKMQKDLRHSFKNSERIEEFLVKCQNICILEVEELARQITDESLSTLIFCVNSLYHI